MFLPTVLLSITYLFTNALQHSGGLLTDALPSGEHNFLRHGKLDNTHVITVTVEDDAHSHVGFRRERRRFLERTFRVFEPANKGDAKRPIILAYHGVMSDSETMQELTQFDREAKDRGWLAVYPQGEWMYSEKMTNWNGAGCCSQGQDDIAFTRDMIDYLKHLRVDRR